MQYCVRIKKIESKSGRFRIYRQTNGQMGKYRCHEAMKVTEGHISRFYILVIAYLIKHIFYL